tara:strand:+ start:2025 stop:2378 length:354 start_codon:yes stop_codon:yes gene_type:complete
MAKKALIFEGKVVDIADTEFEVHKDFTWVDATDDTEFHGSWDGSKFGPADTRTDEQKTEAAWVNLRLFRDSKLRQTDWMALSDVTMSDAWKKYRQDLRDLPANTANPMNITWPTQPS